MTAKPNPDDIMSHGEFRKTDTYREICADFAVDPAASWDTAALPSITEACDFLFAYETARRDGAAWTPERAAAAMEGLLLSGEGNASGLAWVERFGPVLVAVDPIGDHWAFTARPYDPASAALAMTDDRIKRTPLS